MIGLKNTKCESDCFASKNGRCKALANTTFDDYGCPFYKPRDEVDLSKIEADCAAYEEAHGGEEEK